ncbi:MAG: DUF4180 domain-containing protein [Salinivirgaceae bacterium]
MKFYNHSNNKVKIAELITDHLLLTNLDNAVDLLGNLYYQGFESLIIHQNQLSPEFFDLKTGLAGDILQKFSNYRIRLAVVGNFSEFNSKSLKDFIYECNQGRQIAFVATKNEALTVLST